ncbi:Asd/ArgC dimerization domain-containing protein [Silvibacterium dinghuense]|uniref:Segregation protein B n=1 Tax=Silvibacterium dinghuense TaxID=1560006 RepID=A0A4Q1SH30_9BACT|nr:Asd/ArgC dimerization domain-containing protein [Silvibacterium dinghuense]RXS96836.1 segregation protein B [Silvibacterium dinghuense]GGG94044.1 aspartate-semialdehyde dehydrogenase [Silvibacterium dinghuense]
MTERYRIAIVGAASLRGKELNEALSESSFGAAEFSLMDDEAQLGQLESVGDEVTFIQRIEPDAFTREDFVFFAGEEETTRNHWKQALTSGASILDLTYVLEKEPGVLVRSPWVREALGEAASESLPGEPDLTTPAIVPAHPVAVALALIFARLTDVATVKSASATVLEPASEYGRAAMDELHQQTVGLLSFQSLPKQSYDAQAAFNLLPVLGEAAKINLGESEARIRRHYALLAGHVLPKVAIQLLHAPVFHGHSFSLALELEQAVPVEHLEAALGSEHMDVVLGDTEPPSNLSSAGQGDVMVRVRPAEGGDQATTRFWIWAALDNLKFGSLNAVACAQDLRRLRPKGKVQ